MSGRIGRPRRGREQPRAAGPGRRFLWRLAATAVAGLAAAIPALPAWAIGPGGVGTFGLTPAAGSSARPESYFSLAAGTGHSARATAIISNLGHKAEMLKISRSLGVTAANGGAAYSLAYQHCSGPACWLTGLPRTVTLPAGSHEALPFTVRIPRATARGQYLAGITAERSARPAAVKVGHHGKATAEAIIVQQVTVGVAITVGNLSRLTTRLEIPVVSGQAIGTTARLNIRLRNTGQTFTGGTGTASCAAAGRRHSYHVAADTVLPHGQAEIAVNSPGLPEGTTVPCVVLLHYGHGLTLRWAGMVALPAPPRATIVHTAQGAYSVAPRNGVPGWAIVLMAIGGLGLGGVGLLLVRMRRLRLAR